MIGADGVFTDINDKKWVGSQILEEGTQQQSLNGVAPSGSITMSFFQDPNAPDLIDDVKSLGLSYIKDRPISFYFQPLATRAEFAAPIFAPILEMTRIMTSLRFSYFGELERSITLTYESWSSKRNAARRLSYSQAGHAALIGETNVSLKYMPTSNFEQEKLFG